MKASERSAPSAMVTSTFPALSSASLSMPVSSATFRSGSSVSLTTGSSFNTGMASGSFISFLYFCRNAVNFALVIAPWMAATATCRISSLETLPSSRMLVWTAAGS